MKYLVAGSEGGGAEAVDLGRVEGYANQERAQVQPAQSWRGVSNNHQ
jgi:hypothetical protein